MTKAVNSFSVLLAYAAFILIFLAGYDFTGKFTIESITPLILKALLGAILFWFSGIIIGDIMFRGIVEDIDGEKLEPLEGGFEQRISEEKNKKRVIIIDKEAVSAKIKEAREMERTRDIRKAREKELENDNENDKEKAREREFQKELANDNIEEKEGENDKKKKKNKKGKEAGKNS
jgi:hypothetical protein